MSAFPDWQKHAVNQRRPATGCIPTAYEMMVRAANMAGIDLAKFQDDFDLDKNGGAPQNHFVSVGRAIQNKYPAVEFACEPFAKGKGQDKVARMDELIRQKSPVLVSLANEASGGRGWHIMPVVDATADEFTLLEYVEPGGKVHTRTIKKAEVARIHDNYAGGDEIAYLKVPAAPTA
jgi:hypothetical protein